MFVKIGELSSSQRQVLQRTLMRAGTETPAPDQGFTDWLDKSQLVIPAGILVGRMQKSDPLAFELRDQDFRKYVLGYMTGFDIFTAARADALEIFLNDLENSPNIPTDSRRLKLTLRAMNRQHREGVHHAWASIDRAYQRFNENIGLGRPLTTALNILFEELYSCRVFSGGAGAQPELASAYETLTDIFTKLKAGKSHPENLIRSSVIQLETIVTNHFQAESTYWYNEVMAKQYVRDVLIPHAVLNGYLDPHQTTDLLGAVWNFITDLTQDPELLVCLPLLRHQPLKNGPRYASSADFLDELNMGRIIVGEFPQIQDRLTARLEQELDPELTQPTMALLSEHPLVRLSHGLEFLPYLLQKQLTEAGLSEQEFSHWLNESFFSIDPRTGVPAQALALALRLAIRELIDSKVSKQELVTNMRDLYDRVLENKCSTAVTALQRPFQGEYLREMRRLDAFELYESMIDLIVGGFYQPHSDWIEEQQLAELIKTTVPQIHQAERADLLDEVENFQQSFTQIEKAIEALHNRAAQVRFDLPALRLWKIFSIDLVRKLNQIKRKQFFSLPFDANLMIAVNAESISELINDKLAEDLSTSIREIASQ